MEIKKTIKAGNDLRLSTACQIIAEHWDALKNGIGLTIDIADVAFLDPSIVALFILVNDYFPGLFEIVNPSKRTKQIIKRIDGRLPAGTLFPAKRVLDALDGTMFEQLKFWISFILNRFYGAPDNSSADFVELASVELINNIIDHSDAPKGGIIVAASFAKRKHFELTVIDFGNTIPGTLESLFPELSDQELIAKALDFGVSRRYGSDRNYGRGLDIVKSYSLQDQECSLIVLSRNGFVSITDAKLHVRPSNSKFPGTLVKCSFSETFVKQHLVLSDETEELEI